MPFDISHPFASFGRPVAQPVAAARPPQTERRQAGAARDQFVARPVTSAGPALGGHIVAAARELKDRGYRYTTNLTTHYNPVRFRVGCCADFAVDAWAKTGLDLYHKIANPHYVPSIMDYMKSRGKFLSAGGGARAGDMVFFRWNGDSHAASHVAIVTGVDRSGRPTHVIESPTFGQPVHERPLGNQGRNIVGFARA